MAVDEHDIELLEMYLDRALDAGEQAELEQRLRADGALQDQLNQLREQRQLRAEAYTSFEPDCAAVDRFLARINTAISRRAAWWKYLRRAGYASAAAAAVAIAFVGGWVGGTQRGSSAHAQGPQYHVQIMDDAGRVMAVQKFDSLQQAREFSEDLQQWQVRQQRLLSGQVTVKSADF